MIRLAYRELRDKEDKAPAGVHWVPSTRNIVVLRLVTHETDLVRRRTGIFSEVKVGSLATAFDGTRSRHQAGKRRWDRHGSAWAYGKVVSLASVGGVVIVDVHLISLTIRPGDALDKLERNVRYA